MAGFCENCGAPLKVDQRFCENCGTEVKKTMILPNTTATEAIRLAEEKKNLPAEETIAQKADPVTVAEQPIEEKTLAHEAELFDHHNEETEGNTGFFAAGPVPHQKQWEDNTGYVEEQGWREKYFSTRNRLNRKRYLLRVIQLSGIVFLVTFAAAIIFPENIMNTFMTFFGGVAIGSNLSLGVRRCHDVGLSGWWMLLVIVPVINFFFNVYLFFKAGQSGPNEYGPDPLR